MLLGEALPPAAPVVTLALAALFTLAALMVCIGLLKLLDAFTRAVFGSIGGAVGWVPWGGKIVKHSLHKLQQKVSHIFGMAERKLDAGVAMTWNNCAHLVGWMASEFESLARTSWHIVQWSKAFALRREMHHEIRTAVKPVRARANTAAHEAHAAREGTKAVAHSVAQGVYPRLKAGEIYDRTVVRPNIRTARAEARAAENQAIATYRWLVKHRTGVLAGVFTGAVAWALTRVGGGWIRCKNWRTIGKHVCRLPTSLIESLLGLGLAFGVVIDPVTTAHVAVDVEDAMESLIRKIAD